VTIFVGLLSLPVSPFHVTFANHTSVSAGHAGEAWAYVVYVQVFSLICVNQLYCMLPHWQIGLLEQGLLQ
jgi:hypothetical protein